MNLLVYSFTVESKRTVIGFLGGSSDEAVEYKLQLGNPTNLAVIAELKFHGFQNKSDTTSEIGSFSVSDHIVYLEQEVEAFSRIAEKGIDVKVDGIVFILTLNAPITTKVVCSSRLLKCLRSLYGKRCGPRSDCSYRSSLFWVHAVCFYT